MIVKGGGNNQETLKPRTIFCHDNLPVLRGINSNSIDLIYLDPPFNSNHNYAAPIGSVAAGAEFKDTWTLNDIDLAWHNEIAERFFALHQVIQATKQTAGDSMMSYLTYMSVRIMEMHRVLKETGSIYLHCDDSAVSYLQLALDAIFGRNSFRNIITWKRHSAHSATTKYGRVQDHILYYCKSKKSIWNQQFTPYEQEYIDTWYKYEDEHGRHLRLPLTGPGQTNGISGEIWKGVNPGKRHWVAPRILPSWFVKPKGYDDLNTLEKLDVLDDCGVIVWPKKRGGIPHYKRYLNDGKGVPISNIWTDINNVKLAKERVGYPTQKPLALLERIILTSSNKGDLVLDPFCGCATTCVAAEKLERNWVGVDVSSKAYDLVQTRLKKDVPETLFQGKPLYRDDIPTRTDNAHIKKPGKAEKERLFGIQNSRCKGCQTKFEIYHLTIDHIVARSKGGGNELENLQLLCGQCNSIKGARNMEYLMAYVNARRDNVYMKYSSHQ